MTMRPAVFDALLQARAMALEEMEKARAKSERHLIAIQEVGSNKWLIQKYLCEGSHYVVTEEFDCVDIPDVKKRVETLSTNGAMVFYVMDSLRIDKPHEWTLVDPKQGLNALKVNGKTISSSFNPKTGILSDAE